MGKNVNFFETDMSLSVNTDNKTKDILILGIGPTQGLDDTTLTAEAKYSIHFSRWNIEKLQLHWKRQLFMC